MLLKWVTSERSIFLPKHGIISHLIVYTENFIIFVAVFITEILSDYGPLLSNFSVNYFVVLTARYTRVIPTIHFDSGMASKQWHLSPHYVLWGGVPSL